MRMLKIKTAESPKKKKQQQQQRLKHTEIRWKEIMDEKKKRRLYNDIVPFLFFSVYFSFSLRLSTTGASTVSSSRRHRCGKR